MFAPPGARYAALVTRGIAVRSHLDARLADLHPAYFALVMATGIVAIACRASGLQAFATLLSRINLIAYPAIWVLFLARVVRNPERVREDWASHQRAPGYFTLVAATGMLGMQAVRLHGNIAVATVLWWATVVFWAACTYTVFTLLTIREHKPGLADGINGGWLLAVVATQSVATLGCALDGRLSIDRDTQLFVLLSFWAGGGMLYFWIIALIFYRYMFFGFSPRDLMPPYWINMGAVAISTLAGAMLADAARGSALVGPLRPFILGMTVMFWATATWWIPMLLVLWIWRHLRHRVPVAYDPLYWGLVFPLGMYAVSTYRLSAALGAPFLVWIARGFVVAALSAWLLTALGFAGRMVYIVVLGLKQRGRHPMPRARAYPAIDL
ncbi:MAG: tellurite resistance/C4-dicarboxylate transporter family protein [Acidobacteria bacterium]|nr:tellurite resistance/C4-dicarboxylate transporter family protein [Acidobacteriota bacterium]